MAIFSRVWSIITLTVKRLLSQRGLVLAATIGLAAAVALSLSIPLYADGVYYQIFENKVIGEEGETLTNRPPFSFVFLYIGAWAGNTQWEDLEPVDQYITHQAGAALNLPQELLVRYVRTAPFPVYPPDESLFGKDSGRLFTAGFAFMGDIEGHIQVTSGSFPAPSLASDDGPIGVLVHQNLADEMGLQPGEEYTIYFRAETETGSQRTIQIPVRISGVWQPLDYQEEYWFFDPDQLEGLFLVPEETFSGAISYELSDEIYSAIWYMVMDGSGVNVGNSKALAARINQVQLRVDTLLPSAKLSYSPLESILLYHKSANYLTILLYAFSVPIIGLILAFIGLVAGLAVERQRNEIAVLRSRGATTSQILGIVLLESVILGLVALVISAPIALVVARLIGQTRSFLDFSAASNIRVGLTTFSVQAGLVTIGLALVARVVPALGAARHTIISYKLERARMLRPPWWQRAWLDVLLFIPAAYGIYLLREQGSLVMLETETAGDPFHNPLLFILPALTIFALTLFLLRLIPPLMKAIAWIAGRTKSVGLLLAARHLSRTPGSYSTPLVLLILTLSLSAFTASLANTLDTHLVDQTYYAEGADISFTEMGAARTESPFGLPTSGEEDTGSRWLFFPVSEYRTVPGVLNSARVGRYRASPIVAGNTLEEGTYIGVDRLDFPQVAFWRKDFAAGSLGALMNALAVQPNGVLVSHDFLNQHKLSGDGTFRLNVIAYGERVELTVKVVGTFELFPTWYPEEDGALFIGNLDYLYEEIGVQLPHEVWLHLDPKVDLQQVMEQGLADMNVSVLAWDAPELKIQAEQARPERQGLFGLLSIGFGAAAVLTVLGFLLYALFSFRKRFIELGVLRASGLSSGQMTSFLAWELIFLILIGGGAGTALGAWVSQLFIPYLQIGATAAERTPPFLVEVAWPAIFEIYALFGLLFLVTLVVLVYLLRRMRIFEAIKLGETV
jgi:putative ABC transport system permease protein